MHQGWSRNRNIWPVSRPPGSRSVLRVCVGLMRQRVRNRIQERAPRTAIGDFGVKPGRPGRGPPRRVPSPDSGRPQGDGQRTSAEPPRSTARRGPTAIFRVYVARSLADRASCRVGDAAPGWLRGLGQRSLEDDRAARRERDLRAPGWAAAGRGRAVAFRTLGRAFHDRCTVAPRYVWDAWVTAPASVNVGVSIRTWPGVDLGVLDSTRERKSCTDWVASSSELSGLQQFVLEVCGEHFLAKRPRETQCAAHAARCWMVSPFP